MAAAYDADEDFWTSVPTGPPPAELPVNARLNFIAQVVTEADATLVRRVTERDCHAVMGAINRGLPMPVYVLDALLQPRVRHPFVKARILLEEAIRLAVLLNHYAVFHLIYLNAAARRRRAFSGANRERLERGLERLERALGEEVRAEALLQAARELDLPDGRAEQILLHLYAVAERAGLRVPGLELAEASRALGLFNYCFRAPRFLSAEAVYTYAAGLASATQLADVPLPLLTAIHRSRDPEHVLNDLLFSVALGNALVRMERHLRAEENSARQRVGRILRTCYACYLQAPGTWTAFGQLAAAAAEATRQIGTEDYDCRRLTAPLFRFVRAVMAVDVYVCPDFLDEQMLGLGLVDREWDRGGPLPVEIDPLALEGYVAYREYNPLNDPDVFRCPRNPGPPLRHRFGLSHRRALVLEEVSPDLRIAYHPIELPDPTPYVREGVAKALRISLASLDRYTRGGPEASLEPARQRAAVSSRVFVDERRPFSAHDDDDDDDDEDEDDLATERAPRSLRVDEPGRPRDLGRAPSDGDAVATLARSVSGVSLDPDGRRRGGQ